MAKGSQQGVISHWYHLIEDFQTSALDFYTAVEEAVERRGVSDIKTSRVEWKEGGMLSAKREYLRIQRGNLAFDVCAAPYGNGYFFSWWMARVPAMSPLMALLALFGMFVVASLIGGILNWIFEGCAAIFIMLVFIPAFFIGLGYGIREGAIPIDEEYVLSIPIVGWLYDRLFNPNAYFRMDSANMYQETVRRAVGEVVSTVKTENGLKALTEDEAKPKLRDLAK